MADRTEPRREGVLVARGLDAGYDGIAVVHGLDLVVDAGEVVALLGANGAGKSTTLLTIAGAGGFALGILFVAGMVVGLFLKHRR